MYNYNVTFQQIYWSGYIQMSYSLKVMNLGGCTLISVKTAFANVCRILISDHIKFILILSFGTLFGLLCHGTFSSFGGNFDFQKYLQVTQSKVREIRWHDEMR